MEAAASTPIAVASASPTNNTRTIYSNNGSPDPRHSPHPLAWPTMTYDLHNMSAIPSNRPVTSASASNNVPTGPISPSTNPSPDSINMAAFPPIRPVNSAPESKNAKRSPTHNSVSDPNTRPASSPRRRRNNVEQRPQNDRTKQNVALNLQNSQKAHNPPNVQHNQNGLDSEDFQNLNPQAAQLLQSLQNVNVRGQSKAQAVHPLMEPLPGRVLVTGYPTYTQPHDILEVFTKFGNVRIDKCNSFSATLTYPTEEQAKKAILANKRLHIYGHFLAVRPYSAKLNAAEGPQSPKREFTMTKQKSVIIEPDKIDLSGDFHFQLDQIMAAIRLNQEDISKISTLYRDLENAFQSQWPGCKAIPFGSITTGLGIKTSDADCFISLPVQFRSPHGNHVNKARRLLSLHPHIFAEILAIPRANTPIVKFYHVPTDINCDLTFKTPLGAQNSRLVAFLLQSDPRITPMAVIIKYWAKVHDLSGTGKLTNYALTLMIIFFLQQSPYCILPAVEWLQRDRANDIIVDGWNTGYMSNVDLLPRSSNKSTIPELIGGFFEYYASFDFDNTVVCPFLGTSLKKVDFMDTAALPEELALYKSNVLNNYVMPIRYQTSFCVQDPFEQCHNVASTITSKLASDIITFFKFAAAAYDKEKSNNCAGLFKAILLDKPKISRGKSHPEYRVNVFPRIINMIIGGDWKVVVRNLVKTLFEKMIKVKLGKVDEKFNPDSKKQKERYTGNLTKPVWKRKKYKALYVGTNLKLDEKQALISEELIKKEIEEVSLQFQLMLTFCNDPKSAVITIRMCGGDLEAFREFGKFFMSVMQGWFTELLKPYSKPYCNRDTAAKIALSVDPGGTLNHLDSDDEENEAVVTPSTNPSAAPAAPTLGKSPANTCELASAGDEPPQEHGVQLSDAAK